MACQFWYYPRKHTKGDILGQRSDRRRRGRPPGGLADNLAVLMDAYIGIEHLCASVTETGKRACAILRLGDNETGEKVLHQARIALIYKDEILRIYRRTRPTDELKKTVQSQTTGLHRLLPFVADAPAHK